MANTRILSAEVFLVFQRSGKYGKLAVRLTQKTPALDPGEISMRLKLSVPDALFDTPQFTAQIEVPSTIPSDIKISLPDDLSRLVKQHMGLDLEIKPTENGTE